MCHFKNTEPQSVNSFRPRDNGRHFADNMLKCILFLNEIYQFWSKFNGCFFLGVKLTISSIGSDNGLVPTTRQTIIWTDGPVWYSAYASLDLNGLMSFNINHFLQMIRADAIDSCFRINKRQNDRHFADDIFKFTSLYDFVLWLLFWLKLLWNLFPKVQLIINMSSLIHWTGFQ